MNRFFLISNALFALAYGCLLFTTSDFGATLTLTLIHSMLFLAFLMLVMGEGGRR